MRTTQILAEAMQGPAGSSSKKRMAPISRASTAYRRKRAVTACQVCRARRTKCDQKVPCSFCAENGAECVFEPANLSTFDPASLFIIDRLEQIERRLDADPRSSTWRRAEAPPSSEPLSPPLPLHNFLPESLEAVLKWPVFQDVTLSITSSPGSVSSWITSSDMALGSVDELDSISCNRWLDSFFSNVHVKNPILDEESTRRLVRRLYLEGVGWDATSCLALIVCANGALARPFSSPSLSQQELRGSNAMLLFAAAQKRLGPMLISSGIVQAQCLYLNGVFLMSILQPIEAWRMFLLGLAICQTLGSVRHPGATDLGDTYSDMTAEESIYWSCWKSEQELRIELGSVSVGTPTLSPPTLFPSLPAGCSGQNLRAWYFYLSEISLWRLENDVKNEITRLVTKAHSGIFDTLAELSASTLEQVAAWRDSLAPIVSLNGHDPLEEQDDVLRFVLRGRLTHIHELITWSFVCAALHSGNVSPTVLDWAAKGLAYHMDRLAVNRPGFYHRHHGTWLLLQTSARSACILLAFARRPDSTNFMPKDWRGAVERTLELLMFWQTNMDWLDGPVDMIQRLLMQV